MFAKENMTIRDAVSSDSPDIARLTSLLGYAADAEFPVGLRESTVVKSTS